MSGAVAERGKSHLPARVVPFCRRVASDLRTRQRAVTCLPFPPRNNPRRVEMFCGRGERTERRAPRLLN